MQLANAVTRGERIWICACLAAILGAAAMQAASRPLWFDELATYYISGAPTAGAIFEALEGAADAQPPVLFFVTRGLRAVFGDSELAVRGQAIAGFGVMLVCLYALVRQYAPAAYGFAAILFAAMTWGFDYAHEARPYGLVMGFCALAVLLWKRATGGPSRRGGVLVCLAATLALMLSSHYYAVLLLIPLGAGEIVRSVKRRAVDWAIWATLAAPTLVLGLYLPFIQAVREAYQENFFSPAEPMDGWGFYFVLLAPAFFSLVAALTAAGFVAWKWDPAPPGDDAAKRGSLYEPPLRTVVLTLALIPLAYVGLAMASTGAFVYRYPLAALVGVALLFVDVLHNQFGSRTKAVAAFCVVMAATFLALRLAPAARSLASGGELRKLKEDLAAIERATADDPAPVTVSAPQAFAQYAHYATPQLRARLEYWADPELAVQYLETDSAELSLRNLAPWAGLEVGGFAESCRTGADFYLAEVRGHKYDWITAELQRRFGPGEEIQQDNVRRLVRISGSKSE
jgi:hypothetical protein